MKNISVFLTLAVNHVAGLLVVVVSPTDPAVVPWLRLGAASIPELDSSSTFNQFAGAQAETGSRDRAPG
jgi:hypothetical protein